MQARRLNREGLTQFSTWIETLRQGEAIGISSSVLTDEATSEAIDVSVHLGDELFATRYELGSALVNAIGIQNIQHLVGDTGFWSWLALYWFDQLCPPNATGTRKPSMVYNYVLSPNYNHRYRHAIYTTWQLVDAYGKESRFLLCKEPAVRGELIEQIMARQYYLSCRGVMETAAKLYWDPSVDSFRRGAASRKSAGCVSRLVAWLQQIELTYDVYSMGRDQLLGIMPAEFDRFNLPE